MKGAPPTRAARRWRLRVPNSGSRAARSGYKRDQYPAHSAAAPRARAKPGWPAGPYPDRHRGSHRVSHVICAWISARRRWAAPPRRFCSAVRIATSGRRRASRARSASVCASGRGRGADAQRRQSAPRRGPRGHPSWPIGPWLWQSRALARIDDHDRQAPLPGQQPRHADSPRSLRAQ